MKATTDNAHAAGSGITHAATLLNFADAIVSRSPLAIDDTRRAVVNELGGEEMVAAAGVVSVFQRMVRVADSTGIAVDPPMQALSEDLRDELGINEYTAAANTGTLSFWQRLFFKTFGAFMFRRMLRRASKD